MKIDTPAKKLAYVSLLVLLVVFSIHGIIFVANYIGMVATHAGKGGYIYQLNIEQRFPVERWAGIYGIAVAVGFDNPQSQVLAGGQMEEENLIFDCFEDNIEHEVYASRKPLEQMNLASVTPATPAEIDALLGYDASDFMSGTRTFTETITVTLGSTTLTVPATYTMKINESPSATFSTGILRDGNGEVFLVSKIVDFQTGFNGRIYNYQMLVPIPNNGSATTWYFWSDPNDVCPEAGNGTVTGTGSVIGNVTDQDGNRLENVIVHVADKSSATNANGEYNVSDVKEGTWTIFAVKEGYQVYYGNVTVTDGNTTIHNIVLNLIQEENPFTNVGPGQTDQTGIDEAGTGQDVGPGQDEGPGQVNFQPIVEQPKRIEGTDYIITLQELKRKLREGEFRQETIRIISYKDSTATVTYELKGNLSGIVTLDKTQSVIEPNGEDYLIATIFGSKNPGIYNGTLEFDGDFNATIPVEIEILDKNKLPVEALIMELGVPGTKFYPSNKIRFQTHLRNLLIDRPYPVRIVYTLQNIEGTKTIWTKEVNTFLTTQQTLYNTIKIPRDVEAGEYILRANAMYLSLYSSTSALFKIDVPFLQRIIFGLAVWQWLLIFFFLVLAAGGFLYWHHLKESKKKFHLKVDYNALPKPGPRSIYVGKIAETDHKTYMNLEAFKTHTIVAGSTGGGKSVSAQVIVEEMLKKDVCVMVFDPTAQWTGMLRKCNDKMMLSLYSMFGMKQNEARAFSGNIREITDPYEIIDFKKYIKPGEIQVFACHKLDPKDMDIFVANSIREVFRYGFDESKELRICFVYDEVHRLLPKFGGSGQGFLQIERACREYRKWGLGVILVSQVLSDFVGTIKANINTEIQMRTRDEGDLERIRVKYGEDVLRSLVKATVGSGMVENPHYNNGKPYFVAFRPLLHSTERLSDEEISQYEEYNNKIDNLLYSLEQLEKEGVDVFDLKLELKLATDKVKTGNFNMVKIYLDGLTPRIDKQWEKLGKKPKPYEKRRASKEEIEAEIAKAKAEHDKAKKEDQKDEGEGKKEITWTTDVPPDKILSLVNGMLVVNLASLYDEIAAMKDEDFAKHVNDQKNDFAVWVRDVIGDVDLANHLSLANTKEDILKLLEVKKNNGKFEKLTQDQLKELQAKPWISGAAPAQKTGENQEKNKEEKQGTTTEKPAGGGQAEEGKEAEGQAESHNENDSPGQEGQEGPSKSTQDVAAAHEEKVKHIQEAIRAKQSPPEQSLEDGQSTEQPPKNAQEHSDVAGKEKQEESEAEKTGKTKANV
ncbi:DUF87 domain-containing protein [Candidatus Woesearchaeota archaeon]|nr:MAG: DUF87 domain-containing protein [Candidatus Woesearchaeota archaeon]